LLDAARRLWRFRRFPQRERLAGGGECERECGQRRPGEQCAADRGDAAAEEQALALMEERHKGYEKIGGAMRTVSKQLKGEEPIWPR
jgi:hypothetical protein